MLQIVIIGWCHIVGDARRRYMMGVDTSATSNVRD